MTLPGLGNVLRLTGLIAIFLSVSSMVSSIVAIFRRGEELERTMVYVGEGDLTSRTVGSLHWHSFRDWAQILT